MSATTQGQSLHVDIGVAKDEVNSDEEAVLSNVIAINNKMRSPGERPEDVGGREAALVVACSQS